MNEGTLNLMELKGHKAGSICDALAEDVDYNDDDDVTVNYITESYRIYNI